MTSLLTRRPSVRRLLGRAGLEKSALSPQAVAEVAARAYARGVPDKRMKKFVNHAARWNAQQTQAQLPNVISPTAGWGVPSRAYQNIPGLDQNIPGLDQNIPGFDSRKVDRMLRPEVTSHLYGGFRGAPPAHEPVAVLAAPPSESMAHVFRPEELHATLPGEPQAGWDILRQRSQQLPSPGRKGYQSIVYSSSHPLVLGHEMGHSATVGPVMRLGKSFRRRGMDMEAPRFRRFAEWLANRQLLANQTTLRQRFADVGANMPGPEATRQAVRLQTEVGYTRPELAYALNHLKKLRKIAPVKELPAEAAPYLQNFSRPYRKLLAAAMTRATPQKGRSLPVAKRVPKGLLKILRSFEPRRYALG